MTGSAPRRPSAGTVAGVVAALATAVHAVVLTRHGMLLNPDSPTYLWTAALLRADPARIVDLPGDTTLSVSGAFPPFYPAVLAAVTSVVGDELVAARVVGIALAMAAGGLMARLVARHSSVVAALVATSLVVGSRAYTLVLFGFVMADGLFVVLALVALSLLEPMLRDEVPRRALRWVGGAVAIGALGLGTRYVGAGLVASVAVVVAFLCRLGARRWWIGAGALVAGAAPMVAWQISDGGTVGPGGFRLGWYPPVTAFLRAGDSLVWSYVPAPVGDALGWVGVRVVGTVLFAAALAWSIASFRRALGEGASAADRVVAATLVVGWGHLATLVVSRLLVDPFIEADGRQPLLWLTCLVVAAGIDVHRRWHHDDRSPAFRRSVVAGVVAAGLLASAPFVRTVQHPRDAWWHLDREAPSSLAERVARLPATTVVYTNREDVVFRLSGHRTRALPLQRVQHSTRRDPTFRQRTRAMGRDVASGGAVVVVFTEDAYWSVPVDLVRRITGLDVIHREAEGVILAPAGFSVRGS